MQPSIDSIYQAACREVMQVQRSLEGLAQLFNETFTLTQDECDLLQVHAELHHSGRAIEISVAGTGVVFSFGTVFDRQCEQDSWELIAFHGMDPTPRWVCTMRVGLTASDYARRLHGARLIAAVGDYVERYSLERQTNTIGRDAVSRLRVEQNTTWTRQIAARSELQLV